MQGKNKELWEELCERAAVEQDSQKLQRLVQEINRLLKEKLERLDKRGGTTHTLKREGL